MKVMSKKTNRAICENCELAEDVLSQVKGLMFSIRRKNILFVFDNIGSHPIHSFFVFFPFHAVYLDWNMKVVDVQRINPFFPLAKNKVPAKFLLEIGDGFPPEVGDRLCLDGKF